MVARSKIGGVDAWDGCSVQELKRRWGVPALLVVETTTSTNDLARGGALAGAHSGSVFIAEHQIEGRGRNGHVWHDVSGQSVLMSVVLRSTMASSDLHRVVASIVAASIDAVYPRIAQVMGTNDVFCGRAKVAGVLVERISTEIRIVGIGVNVLQDGASWPPDLHRLVGSIFSCTGVVVKRSDVAGQIIRRLQRMAGENAAAAPDHAIRTNARRDAGSSAAARTESGQHGSVWLRRRVPSQS